MQTLNPKRIVILGSTGSIGRQALEVARAMPQHLRIVGLVAGRNAELFAQQVAEFRPEVAALFDENAAQRADQLLENSDVNIKIGSGENAILDAATWENADIVLGAMLGAAGLPPTMAAIEARKGIAIANKETLVAAGAIVTAAARKNGVRLLPVDSEHSAIAQCLMGENSWDPKSPNKSTLAVQKLTLTASGGALIDVPKEKLSTITAAQALRHPNWDMGAKITIDSATLMNKGLEIIEASWLFGVPQEKIEVLVHRQSIVHSMVTFCDNSVKAQMGVPDMRLPIQWALSYPQRVKGIAPPLDLVQAASLTFESPRNDSFPALQLARHAMELGGTAPAVLSAANEIAVAAFLENRCGFYGITDTVESVLNRHRILHHPSLDEVLFADEEARRHAVEMLR